jgi:hypothetical protein
MNRRLVPVLLALPLLVPLASPAQAAAPTSGPVTLVTHDGSLYTGSPDLSSTALNQKIAPNDESFAYGLQASADGSRFAYALEDVTASPRFVSRIGIRDAGGRLVRYLDLQRLTETESGASGTRVLGPSLSPDGNQVVYTVVNSLSGVSLRKGLIAASGLGVSNVPNTKGLHSPVVLTNNLLVLALRNDTVVSVTPLGTRRVVTGLPTGIAAIAVSPDRSTLAYVEGFGAGAKLTVAPLTAGTYPDYSAGTPTVLVSDFQGFGAPQFSHDGATLLWTQDTDASTDVFSVPVTGGTPTNLTQTDDVDEEEAVGALLDDGTAPGPVTAPTVTLGEHPLLRWTLPADTDLSGVSVVRTAPGKPTQVRFVPAPLTSYSEASSLTDTGTTYHYAFTAVDRSGHAATTSPSLDMQPRMAGLRTAYPTSVESSVAAFPVHMPVGTYNLSVRTNGTGDFVRIATGGSGDFVFGKDYGTTSVAGSTYQFRVQVFDDFGNATSTRIPASAVVPYDQNGFTFTGPTASIGSTAAFLGTERVLRSGSEARFQTTGNTLLVIGARCGTCGVLDVFVDGRRISTTSTTYVGGVPGYKQDRQVLMRAFTYGGTHKVVMRASGGDVILDGLAYRH